MRVVAALATGAVVGLALTAASGRLPAPGRTRTGPSDRGTSRSAVGAHVAGIATAVAVLAAVTAATGAPAVGVVPAIAVAVVPAAVLAREHERRSLALRTAWPDALREVLAGIASGASLPSALASLAEVGPPPLRPHFARFAAGARAAGTVAALEALREELADPAADRIIEVLVIAHEQGGAVVGDALRELADAAVADLRAAEQIATEALEGRLNARAVLVLPWVVLLLLAARPGPFRDFYASTVGMVVVVLAAAWSAAGLWLVERILRLPPEPRVLARPLQDTTS